jgi:hypothetical protein
MKKLFFLAMINKLKQSIHLLSFIIFLGACKKEVFKESIINEKPVAIAGPDQAIAFDSVFLSGGNSYKNGGTITGYLWTKIYGPVAFNIKDPSQAKTVVSNLVQGVYRFELKVTDNSGLFAKDTVQVTVNFPPSSFCNNNNRQQVNVQLLPVGTLSELRCGMAIASAGNKILFAGGYKDVGPSTRIDIYDITTQVWSTAELSVPGFDIKAVTCGNKIFLVGGEYDYGSPSRFVDVYDVTTNTWSVDSLSEPRWRITVGTVGNKVFFAGGEYRYLAGEYSPKVDIYDLSTNAWTTTNFNVGRTYMSTVTANNKLYFAGGLESFNDDALDRIDSYDNTTGTWSVSHLSEPKIGFAAIASADKIYWAGGVNARGGSCSVEIKDVNTGASTNAYLFKAADSLYYYGDDKAVMKNDKIVFRPRYNDNKFDIYDIGTNSWYIGVLPVNTFRGGSIISVNNTIYIAGATVNGVLSNQVWKLEF